MSEPNVQQLEDIEAMFVQCAHGMTMSDSTVTFHGQAHSTLFFADRPQRVVGQMHTNKFVSDWGVGDNNFAEDPPNAVSFLPVGRRRGPRKKVVDGSSRSTYCTEDTSPPTRSKCLIGRRFPAKAGPCTLFIDPFGRPLSPVSAAGMHRRGRRRDRR